MFSENGFKNSKTVYKVYHLFINRWLDIMAKAGHERVFMAITRYAIDKQLTG